MHIRNPLAPRFALPGLSVVGLASPSRGARETCAWRLTLAPGMVGATHAVDREEIFVAVGGRGVATVGERTFTLESGDALIVPADHPFSLANPNDEPFEAVAVLPVGGQARYGDQPSFSPPWTE